MASSTIEVVIVDATASPEWTGRRRRCRRRYNKPPGVLVIDRHRRLCCAAGDEVLDEWLMACVVGDKRQFDEVELLGL